MPLRLLSFRERQQGRAGEQGGGVHKGAEGGGPWKRLGRVESSTAVEDKEFREV